MDPVTLAAILSGAISLGGSIYGTITGNQRRSEAEALADKRKTELTDWRNNEIGQNYVDRADSQALLRTVKENNKEQLDAMETNAIKTGATDEAKVAAAGKLNKNVASAVSNIAAMGQHHKDNVQSQYLQGTQSLDNLRIQNLMDNSGTENMVKGLSDSASSIAQLYAQYGS